MRATAVFRPLRGDVAVMFIQDFGIESRNVPIEQARALHASLTTALRCADAAAAGDPNGAVR